MNVYAQKYLTELAKLHDRNAGNINLELEQEPASMAKLKYLKGKKDGLMTAVNLITALAKKDEE